MLVGDSSPDLFTMDFGFGVAGVFGVTYPIFPGLLNANLNFQLFASLDIGAGFDLLGVAQFAKSLDYRSQTDLLNSMQKAEHLLKDGFYFEDQNDEDDDTGLTARDGDVSTVSTGGLLGSEPQRELPEVVLSASLSVGASIGPDLGVFNFTAGVNGIFSANILLDLNDLPNQQFGSPKPHLSD